jgi:GT2 family glycosyltransferase
VSKYNDIGDALEIIVVDNNSTNYIDMHDKIKSLYPDVRIIANTKNGGYGQGNNIGIRAASASIVSIMNPDVRLIMPVFQTFIDVLSKEENIMCGGKQYATMTKQNPSFYYDFTESGFRQVIGRIICQKLDIYNQKRMWLQGAFFAIKKNIFEQIGLFDENIFMYAEEFDIHLRLKKHFPKKHIKYIKQAKYLHLTNERVITEDVIKKQYEANIYVCLKSDLSLKKMINNMSHAITYNRILSFIIGANSLTNIMQVNLINNIKKHYKI